jgi:hypothetical protein
MCLCLQEVASGLGESRRGWMRWLHDCMEHIGERPMGQLHVGQREIALRESEDTQVRCSEEILELLFASTNYKEDGDAAELWHNNRRRQRTNHARAESS